MLRHVVCVACWDCAPSWATQGLTLTPPYILGHAQRSQPKLGVATYLLHCKSFELLDGDVAIF